MIFCMYPIFFSTFRFKFSESKSVGLTYKTSSENPTINQLQPIVDNTNPNFINIGNPKLLPTFSHEFNLNYNSWKSISGSYTWLGADYNYTNNDIEMLLNKILLQEYIYILNLQSI